MKIDIYTHWWPKKAARTLLEKAKAGSDATSVKYLQRRESRTARAEKEKIYLKNAVNLLNLAV